MSRGIPAWAVVSGLTVGAMVVVGGLAVSASGSAGKPTAAPPAPKHTAATHPHTQAPPPPVPANSGDGKREVYSLSQQRVWVVPPNNGAVSTFTVVPGTVPAQPGTYYVKKQPAQMVGGDGRKIEHVVYFEYTAETWVAFSAQVDGKVDKPDPSLHTGAVRGTRADIAKIWNNTVNGSTVVVVK
ncbi:hypothetical protein [Actinacidiphila yeochonensis]|uniref:hypothetical protein n=1 Tax=Actinacidiphila yeochonensis TaxID=89050 RepID=UPI000562B494|nr:hypothetical protein [Actinacidiphila yeochonensis]